MKVPFKLWSSALEYVSQRTRMEDMVSLTARMGNAQPAACSLQHARATPQDTPN